MLLRAAGALGGAWLGVLVSWRLSGPPMDRRWSWPLVLVVVPIVAAVGWYLGGEAARRQRRRDERFRR